MTKNKVIKRKNYYLLALTNRVNSVIGYTKVDIDDYDKVSKFRWHKKVTQTGQEYAVVNFKQKSISLHNLILGGKFIDHINRDGLDNRKNNLRFADDTLQNINKGLQKNNKSGVRGVYLHKKTIAGREYNYWTASITFNGRKMFLGQSKNKHDVIKLREQAELKYFKHYANT